MPSRQLPFPVFDSDNHFYETRDALTKFLPKRAKGIVDYVDVGGRTKIAFAGQISDMIPNPTFDVVARPGGMMDYFRYGNPDNKPQKELIGEPMRALPAMREPGARLEMMDELGLDHTLMFPTLASLVEERLKDEPDLMHDVIHALNEWMYETWSFNYEGRIFATPVITLPIVDRALEELQWVLDRGAKVVLVRPAPVPGYKGSRSFALPEFDPFWQACVAADLPVAMHASDSGYSEMFNAWEPGREFLPFRPTPFRSAAMGKRAIIDAMLALTCHGALSRNPDLRILSIENGADWVPQLFKSLKEVYKKMPGQFAENPIEAFRRGVYVNPFWEDDWQEVIEHVGIDRVLFGSDWPHPEGLDDPLHVLEHIGMLSEADQAKIMGGNLFDLLKIKAGSKVSV